MDLTLILLATILILPLHYFLQWYKKRKRIAELIDPLGGAPWYPFIGTTWSFIKASREGFYDAFVERNRLYGPLYRSWMGSIPAIHIMKPKHMEVIMNSNEHITKGDNYRFVVPWLGDGLITGSGNKWRHHRKMITPSFHFAILDGFTEVFSERGEILTQVLLERSRQNSGDFFDVYHLLSHCQLDIICETAMGVKLDSIHQSNHPYVKAVYAMSELALHRMFHPYLHPDFIFNLTSVGREHNKTLQVLHQFTGKVIQDRKKPQSSQVKDRNKLSEEDILLGKKQRHAFLDLLLEANEKAANSLSDQEIREEVDTFMFAGHDTTTVTIGWTLFVLANHPEVQKRVQEELDEIFNGEERPITPQDVQQMNYLDRVIKETQRVMPVIPVIARRLTEEVILDGHKIPSECMVVLHLMALHLDEESFPEPNKFDPDRFLPENIAKRHPFAYVPFSAGPRNCIGQKFAQRNSKVVLSSILRKTNVKSKLKISEMKYRIEVVLRPQDGLFLSFEPRDKATN